MKRTPKTTVRAIRPTEHTRATKAVRPTAKPTLIMIHGFRGTHHGLLLIAKQLKNYDIIIPDLPGFGRGQKLKTYDLDSYVEWLRKYIEKHGAKTKGDLHLLGHSFGSIICAAYAEKYPKTIKKLILVNPIGIPALEGPNRIMTRLAIMYYKIGAKLPEKLAHGWLSWKLIVLIMSNTMAKTTDKGLRTFIHHQHYKYFSLFKSPQSVLESFTTSVSHNVSEFAPGVKNTTLLIAGTLDDITPLSDQYALQKKFPKAKLKVIDNVGHLTHYETPEKVARHIQAFTNPL